MGKQPYQCSTVLVLLLCCACARVRAGDIDWAKVKRVADAQAAGRHDGGQRVQDLLEMRAKQLLDAVEHCIERTAWEQSKDALKQRLAASIGVDRLPEPAARHVQLVGTIDRGDYVVEKIVFESFPGTHVPAHLYRPVHARGGAIRRAHPTKLPAVLFVPGHWWEDSKTRPDFQAFCINMARLGFVVLTYDPVGQGERGVSFRDHRRTPLLLLGVSQEGVTVFESLCALEYLRSRPEVDASRIGITGASGGGYNSWMMTALDERIAVSVPVVGTSEFYEQLHVCRPLDWYQAKEHCHFVPGLLRFANNHELIALAAPRPVLVISAQGDESFPVAGIREVVNYGRELYASLGEPESIGYFEDAAAGHGYQQRKREAAYGWFLRWLQGVGTGGPVPEPPTETSAYDAVELRCFADGANEAAGPGIMREVRQMVEQLPAAMQRVSREELRRLLCEALGVHAPQGVPSLMRSTPSTVGSVRVERVGWRSFDGLELGAVLVAPRGPWRGAVVGACDAGKEQLLENAAIRAAVRHGCAAVLVDVRGLGELELPQPNWSFAVSLLTGENFVGRQALDLMSGRRALANLPELRGKPVGLVGRGPFAGMAALYAAVLEPETAWLVTEGGFVSYRSFIERPKSLEKSYHLATVRDDAWENLDREVPSALFVFDVLRHFDLPDLYHALSARGALIVRPIDGDWEPMSADAVSHLLGAGRFVWSDRAQVAVGENADDAIEQFVEEHIAP